MSKSRIKQHFNCYPELDKLYVTEDGKCFTTEERAREHAGEKGTLMVADRKTMTPKALSVKASASATGGGNNTAGGSKAPAPKTGTKSPAPKETKPAGNSKGGKKKDEEKPAQETEAPAADLPVNEAGQSGDEEKNPE